MTVSNNSKKRLIAVCGKGGTGKTAFTAMTTKVLIENDKTGRLLLIDADPAMGLPSALGVDVKHTMGNVREEIIKTAQSGSEKEQKRLGDMLDYMVLEALNEMDKFALLAMGRTETLGCFCPVNDLLRGAIETLSDSFDTIFIDGEAGLEQINRQVVKGVDTLLIVSDATSRGLQTAALIERMVHGEKVIRCEQLGLVFNKVQGSEDLLKKAADDIGVEVFGFIPLDANVTSHDLIGKPLMELPDDSSALVAIRNIVETYVLN